MVTVQGLLINDWTDGGVIGRGWGDVQTGCSPPSSVPFSASCRSSQAGCVAKAGPMPMQPLRHSPVLPTHLLLGHPHQVDLLCALILFRPPQKFSHPVGGQYLNKPPPLVSANRGCDE